MSKDPAVLLYTSDFLIGVADMPFLDRGYYITLLCLQHQKGHIPEETICFSLGLCSVSEIPKVMCHFEQDENGNYFNDRMERETLKRQEYTESRRENGQKGGRPPKNKTPKKKAYAKPYGSAMRNHMENENEDVNEDINITSNDTNFDSFWSAYPKKQGKEPARKSFKKIADKVDIQTLLIAISKQKQSEQWQKSGGQYIPLPSTWLNQRRWEDEVDAPKPYNSSFEKGVDSL